MDSERDAALTRRWRAEDHPQLAAWLKLNARPLNAAVDAASTRNRFLCARYLCADADDWLVSVILPGLANYRDLSLATSLPSCHSPCR